MLLRYLRLVFTNRRVSVLILFNLLLLFGNWSLYSSESSSQEQLTNQVLQLRQELAEVRAAHSKPHTTPTDISKNHKPHTTPAVTVTKLTPSTRTSTKIPSTPHVVPIKSNSQEYHGTGSIQALPVLNHATGGIGDQPVLNHATGGIRDQPQLGLDGQQLNGGILGNQPKPGGKEGEDPHRNNPHSISQQGQPHPDYTALRKGYQIPAIQYTKLVNCDALFNNSTEELSKAKYVLLAKPKVPIYEETYMKWLENCEEFKKRRGYITIPLTQEEEVFPLAFSISMYTDVELTERLLRSIYQPQNLYCIHIDIKSSLLIHRTVRRLVSCFPNVFIASHLDKIKWGDVSVLLPALNCMQDLDRYYRGRWKYYINLTGQELPLKSNWELVQIAKIFNGSNDIAGSAKRMEMDRVKHLWMHRWSKTYQQTIFFDTNRPKAPPPHNLTFYKGELHGLFTQRMVSYIINSNVSKDYLKWCWDSGHPSEHYWNTLNYNLHLAAPGGYQGPQDLADSYSYHPAIRAKHWQDLNYGTRECQGKLVRGICIYGVGDVPWLAQRQELFANKFHLTYEYLAYDCMEQRHRERVRQGAGIGFNADYYKNLPTVRFGRKDGYFNR